MTVYHKKTGQSMEIDIRPFEPADAPGVLDCVRTEYGGAYHREEFCTEESLCVAHRHGSIKMFVVHSTYGVSGFIGMRTEYPEDSSCELISEIFKPELRGYGLAEPLVKMAISHASEGDFTCISAHPLPLHTISQRILERQGFIACGMILSLALSEAMRTTFSESMGGLIKFGLGVQILPLKMRNAGILYLPEALSDFSRLIYSRLGIDIRIRHERTAPVCASVLKYANDDTHRSGTITITRAGSDVAERVQSILQRYKCTPLQTFNAFININDPCAVYVYDVLAAMGFWCTGFNPLCGTCDYLIMHYPNGVNPCLDNYQLCGQFEDIREFILCTMAICRPKLSAWF